MKVLALADSPFFPSPFKKYYLDKFSRLMNHTTMRQTLFTTAVILAIGDLRQKGPFSIHDVTKHLRDQVNNGQLQFSDRDLEDVNGVDTYRVDHQEVKIVFNDLYDNVLQNLDRHHNGTYFVYSDTNSQGSNVQVCCGHGAPVSTSIVAFPVTQQAPQKATFQPKLVKDPILDKVKDYLVSRMGTTTTMKQIQSRFKGVNRTCADYADMLLKAGYTLRNTNLTASKYSV